MIRVLKTVDIGILRINPLQSDARVAWIRFAETHRAGSRLGSCGSCPRCRARRTASPATVNVGADAPKLDMVIRPVREPGADERLDAIFLADVVGSHVSPFAPVRVRVIRVTICQFPILPRPDIGPARRVFPGQLDQLGARLKTEFPRRVGPDMRRHGHLIRLGTRVN